MEPKTLLQCPTLGASSNSSSSDDDLHVALENLSSNPYVRQWDPGKSVFKLLYILCLPELDEVLDNIKNLSSKIDTNNMTLNCVMEGEVAQVAALLLFEWDSLVAQHGENALEHSPIAARIRTMCSPSPNVPLLPNYKAMQAILHVLDSVRDNIHAYRESGDAKHVPHFVVAFDVGNDIWSTSEVIISSPKDVFSDDIPCLRPEHSNPDLKDQLKEALRNEMNNGSFSLRLIQPPNDPDEKHQLADDEGFDKELCDSDECYYDYFLRMSIEHDMSDIFVELITNSKYKLSDKDLRALARLVVGEGAYNCFCAILNEKLNNILTLPHVIPTDAPNGWTVLHEAARSTATKIIEELLENGFRDVANVEVDCSNMKYLNLGKAVPLDLALSNARRWCQEIGGGHCWGGNKSAVGLVITLCRRFMNSHLAAVEILVQETDKIQQKFDQNIMAGKIVEVCILLMVAPKQLLASSDLAGGSERIAKLCSLPQWKGTPREKREMLVLLDIFGKVGDELRAYLRLTNRFELNGDWIPLDIDAILEDVGLSVAHEDTYNICSIYRPLSMNFKQFLTREEADERVLALTPSSSDDPC